MDTFVPNDVYLVGSDFSGNIGDFDDEGNASSDSLFEDSHNSILVCTGANACGKVIIVAECTLKMLTRDLVAECLLKAGCHDTIHGAGVFESVFIKSLQ